MNYPERVVFSCSLLFCAGKMSEIVENELTTADSEVADLTQQGITQKITRSISDGFDTIVAVFRCDFEPDQNRYFLNIPIHPALAEVPDVETMVFEESVRIRITNREKFGVRLELVCSEPSSKAKSIFVETIISSKAVQ